MSSKTSIPIVICAKDPHYFTYITSHLEPSFEVLAVFSSPTSATTELSMLLLGSPIIPSSGYGTLCTPSVNAPAIPLAVIVGGGLSDADYDGINLAVKGLGSASELAWFRTDRSKNGRGPPTREDLLGRVKGALEAWRNEGCKGQEVYTF